MRPMKNKISHLVLVTLIFHFQNLSGQAVLLIPYANTPTIDGLNAPGEWDAAGLVEIPILNNSKKVEVRFMHDSANLHIAFWGNLESSNVRFPEVLLDINYDKSASWHSDDWWFHVSATDCEFQGQYGNYVNCQVERPNWKAEKNFSPGLPKTDTVEIQIPFGTLGIDIQNIDTIGIAFLVTNTASAWEYWPLTANRNVPSTWSNAIFNGNGAVKTSEPDTRNLVLVFPNPTTGVVNVPAGSDVAVFDVAGRLMLKKSDTDRFDISHLASGMYVLRISGDVRQASEVKMIVKE